MGTARGGNRTWLEDRVWNAAGRHLVTALILIAVTAAAVPIAQAGQDKTGGPLDARQIEGLVEGGVYSGRIAHLVAERGIDFKPGPAFLRTLREDGAQEVLIQALLAARSPARSAIHRAGNYRNQNAQGLSQGRTARILALAQDYDQQRQWAQAEQEYRAALTLEPRRSSIHAALGRVLTAENDPRNAIQEYREAINLQPSLAGAHQALGALLMKTGDVHAAISEYREALRLEPGDVGLHATLAALLYSHNDLAAAVSEYDALETLKPDDPDVHYRLGLALYTQSKLSAASAEFRRALTLNSGFTEAHAALGDVLLKQGDRDGALQEYQKAAKPGDPARDVTFDRLSGNPAH